MNVAKECDGCGACQPQEEYVLYCDNCKREIDNLEEYAQLGDYAYCEECVDKSWRQWYRSPEGVPARLRRFRQKHNMRQVDLADLIGVSKSLVASWERGTRPVHERYVYKIAEVTGGSYEERH